MILQYLAIDVADGDAHALCALQPQSFRDALVAAEHVGASSLTLVLEKASQTTPSGLHAILVFGSEPLAPGRVRDDQGRLDAAELQAAHVAVVELNELRHPCAVDVFHAQIQRASMNVVTWRTGERANGRTGASG